MKNHELITSDEDMMKAASDEFFRQFIKWANSSDVTGEGWIPVEDRLPEKGEEVLVSLLDRTVETGRWYGYRWETPLRYSVDVVAWMPLPEPYKSEN